MVVLPAPFGPRKPKISPSFTSRFRLSTAFTGSFCISRRKVFVRPSILIAVPMRGDTSQISSGATWPCRPFVIP